VIGRHVNISYNAVIIMQSKLPAKRRSTVYSVIVSLTDYHIIARSHRPKQVVHGCGLQRLDAFS